MTKWVTIQEASVMLGMSERTIWRRVSDGSIEAKLEGTRRLIKVVTEDDKAVIDDMPLTDKNNLIKWLHNELKERNKQIELLQAEVKEIRDRSDAIVMRLAEELEAQRLLFLGLKVEKKRDRSFWKLLGKSSGNDDVEQ
jgi:hypothetical protein